MGQFVHLRLHTEYSLVDGIVRVPELMAAVAAARMPAIGLTDQCNLFAMVKFYKEALAAGVKPLIGVDAWIREPGERMPPSRIVFLCQNLSGYRHLTQLVTRSFLEGQQRGAPMLERGWLEPAMLEGLIVLSGGAEGDIGQALSRGNSEEAGRCLARWQSLCGDRFYLEVQRTGRRGEAAYSEAVLDLACERGVPAVATNDVRFLTRAEFEAHEARVCIREGALLADMSRPRRFSEEQYLKTPDEMRALFADAPALIENTVEIAKRCSLEIKLGASMLPAYPVPAGRTTEDFLREEARQGLSRRLEEAQSLRGEAREAEGYAARLELELGVICSMGFAGYFLIVADFIRWAREHGVPVGPGRGSGAGSLVAYVLGITDLDPIEHDLLFERFLNPERVSMPDFDVDFCMDGRDRVIDYVAKKFGRERVSQIITYGTLAAKAVIRDVGRVLGHNYGYVDKIAKLVPFEIGITLDKALEQEEELRRLYTSDADVRELIDLARALEGLARNAGTHAGGVVIAPSVLTDFTPLYCEEGGSVPVTQFDKDDVEAAGLVKFDFLGLRTLTVIDWAVRDINALRAQAGEPPLDMRALPVDDAATYQLLKSCKTTAVFQLESRGMKDLIRRLQPDRFGDIVALVALFRPGPLQSGMVEDFIARKHDTSGATIDYLHPELKPVLEATYGVILYQEQVMQIAQILAGYTLGGADLLRRAMGKKKPEEMAKQRSVFLSGAVARGVRESQASLIFDLMEKFAGYGFNKSHSAAYAVLSYQTAWLKAHYPAAFMAAVLSADMDKTDKIVTLIDECASMSLTVHPPEVNESVYAFKVAGPTSIRFGLGAIKGVGASAVQAIVEERDARGPFQSLPEMCRRIDLQRVNRRVLEALIKSGSSGSRRSESRDAQRRARPSDAPGRAEFPRHERRSGGPVRTLSRGAWHGRRLDRGAAPGGRAGNPRTVLERPPDHTLRARPQVLSECPAGRRRRAEARRGTGRAGLESGQTGHGGGPGARNPPPPQSGDSHPGRPHGTARGKSLRGNLPAIPRHHRQGRDPHRRGDLAVRRLHRGVATAGEEPDGHRPRARAVRPAALAALAGGVRRAARHGPVRGTLEALSQGTLRGGHRRQSARVLRAAASGRELVGAALARASG